MAETAKGGDELWICTIALDKTGSLRLEHDPERVDSHRIDDVAVVPGGPDFGLAYSQDNRLVYRWPWNAAPRTITSPIEQGVLRSTGVADAELGKVALALLIQLQHGNAPTTELLGYVLGPDGTKTSRLAKVFIPPNRLGQPPLQAVPIGAGVAVGMVIAGGSLVQAKGPPASLPPKSGSAGELVTLGLSVTRDRELRIDKVNRAALPAEPELEFMTNVAFLDTSMQTMVTAGRIVRLVTLEDDSATMEQLSSQTGCGEMYSSPTVQALSFGDSISLVTWIDTEGTLGQMSLLHEDYDPTIYGGEIRARWVTHRGQVLSKPVSGFPMHTRAQCIRMGNLSGQPFVAWIEASGSSVPPRPVALRIKLLATGETW